MIGMMTAITKITFLIVMGCDGTGADNDQCELARRESWVGQRAQQECLTWVKEHPDFDPTESFDNLHDYYIVRCGQ